MKKAVTAVVLTALGLLPLWSAQASSLTLPTSLEGLSAAQVASLSLASAHAQGSVISDAVGRATGYSFSESTDSGASVAQQRITLSGASGLMRLVGGTLYANLDARMILLQFGVSAPTDANRWIAITRADKNFATFAAGLLFPSVMAQVRPVGPLTMSGVGNLKGRQVVAIGGTANAQLGLSASAETLFVSATAPYLPVEFTASGRADGVPTTLTVTFSNWGRQFVFPVPHDSVPISTTSLP
jgi:hypothetical protein